MENGSSSEHEVKPDPASLPERPQKAMPVNPIEPTFVTHENVVPNGTSHEVPELSETQISRNDD